MFVARVSPICPNRKPTKESRQEMGLLLVLFVTRDFLAVPILNALSCLPYPVCDQRFSCTVPILKAHEKIHTGDQRSNLKRQETIHTGEKSFLCSVCDRRSSRSCNLKDLERTHTIEKTSAISDCDQGFSQRSNLRRHQSILGKKSFVWSVCGKRFPHDFYLNSNPERLVLFVTRDFPAVPILKALSCLGSGIFPKIKPESYNL
ncbi:unnamed protein product, partial [Cyprideis torosa]